MAKREVTVGASVGLHARPAAAFAKAAATAAEGHGATITIGRADGAGANACSVVSVMSLGAKHDETLVLEVSGGDDDDAVLAELAALVEAAE